MGYYDTATTERAEVLKRFRTETQAVDLRTDTEFQRILREAQALLEMSDQDVADALSVSRPTVNRWTNGKNLPYFGMRKAIRAWIEEQLRVKIKRLEASAYQFAAETPSRQVASSPVYGSFPAMTIKCD